MRRVPEHLKRKRAGWVTLQGWVGDWLKAQPRPAGRVIEDALKAHYGIKPPVVEEASVSTPDGQDKAVSPE